MQRTGVAKWMQWWRWLLCKIQVAVARWNITPKLLLDSNFEWTCSPIKSAEIVKSFWIFTLSTATILPCALCKISERFDNWVMSYGQTRFEFEMSFGETQLCGHWHIYKHNSRATLCVCNWQTSGLSWVCVTECNVMQEKSATINAGQGISASIIVMMKAIRALQAQVIEMHPQGSL